MSLTRCFLHILTFLHSVKMFDASASRAVSGSEIKLCTLFSLRVFWFVSLGLFGLVFFFSLRYLTPTTPVHVELETRRYSEYSL